MNPGRAHELDASLRKSTDLSTKVRELRTTLQTAMGSPQTKSSHGGNVQMTFVNHALQSACQDLGRKMTIDEWRQCKIDAHRDWVENYMNDPERYALWHTIYLDEVAAVSAAKLAENTDADCQSQYQDGAGYDGPWDLQDAFWPISTTELGKALAECGGGPRRAEGGQRVYRQSQYYVRSSEVPQLPPLSTRDSESLCGCFGRHKNICETANRMRMSQVEAIHSALNAFQRAVGKIAAESVDVLVHLQGSDELPHATDRTRIHKSMANVNRKELIALLAIPHYKPWSHEWTLCNVVPTPEGDTPSFAVPCQVEVVARPTILSSNYTGSAVVTGWELAEFMARCCDSWVLRRLNFEPLTVLRYLVTAADAPGHILKSGVKVASLTVSRIGKDSPLADLRALLPPRRTRGKVAPYGARKVEVPVAEEPHDADGLEPEQDDEEDGGNPDDDMPDLGHVGPDGGDSLASSNMSSDCDLAFNDLELLGSTYASNPPQTFERWQQPTYTYHAFLSLALITMGWC